MGKNSAPSIPNTPTKFTDPGVNRIYSGLENTGNSLISGNYGFNSGLNEATQLNPQITQLMLQGLQAQLAMPLQQQRQDTINQLEANGQLTGSTTASALGNIDQNYTNQLVSAGAEAGMADINRALSNRVALFGTGLNTLQAAGQGYQGAENATNQFNLDNYQNQVAKVLGEQKQQSGGLMGALTGGLGGVMGGIALAPLTGGASMIPALAGIGGGLGAVGGAFSPQGTGGALFQSGAGLAGSSLGNATSKESLTNLLNSWKKP